MNVLYFVLVLLALICFAVAAANRGTAVAKWNLVALGLAFWVAVEFIQRLKGLS